MKELGQYAANKVNTIMGRNYRNNDAYVPLIRTNNEGKKQKKNKTWKVPFFWVVTAMLFGTIYIINYFELQSFNLFNRIAQWSYFPDLPNKDSPLNGYLINTPGCRIPDMDPYDPSVKEFIKKPEKMFCSEGLPSLFKSNLTSLFLMIEYLPLYRIRKLTHLQCCYKRFWRKEPIKRQTDSQVAYSKRCLPIKASTVRIEAEYIKVICRNKKKQVIYEDYFAFVPLKKKIQHYNSTKAKPNILIIGVDGVSRVNLHRQLPNTFKYLTETLGGVELLGYNKVAYNTFANLIPVLTGMFVNELEKKCWHNSYSRFDKCPFLWTNFSQNEYITAFGEDCSWLGLFNYQKAGFSKQPTDYFYTSFNREMESKIGTEDEMEDNSCLPCVGKRETYKVTLDYIETFAIRMKLESVPYFAFFWGNTLSHDYLNKPALGDQSYHRLFTTLKEKGHLNNTILIFMSDHGIRWGGIRQTYQGRLEERLPFVVTVLPEWFKNEYPAAVRNLHINKRRLTTPFDLRETLKDLLDLNKLKNASKIENVARGYSLFDEIPQNRTCESAEIESHWCTCQESIELMTNDIKVIAAARFAVHNMNFQLKRYAQCATLVLDSILNARVSYHDQEHFTNHKSIVDYSITLKTMPGSGVFEVTVRDKSPHHKVLETKKKADATVKGKSTHRTILKNQQRNSDVFVQDKNSHHIVRKTPANLSVVSVQDKNSRHNVRKTSANLSVVSVQDKNSHHEVKKTPANLSVATILYKIHYNVTNEALTDQSVVTVKNTSSRNKVMETENIKSRKLLHAMVRREASRHKGLKPQHRTPSDEEQWKHFSITGTISRLNLYRQQSYCIPDFHLKLYCYCKSLLKL